MIDEMIGMSCTVSRSAQFCARPCSRPKQRLARQARPLAVASAQPSQYSLGHRCAASPYGLTRRASFCCLQRQAGGARLRFCASLFTDRVLLRYLLHIVVVYNCIASYCIECGGARNYVGHYHTKSYSHKYTYKDTHKDTHKYATYRYTFIQLYIQIHVPTYATNTPTKNAHKYTYS